MEKEEIICPQCGHSIKDHRENEEGAGECLECKRINPEYDPFLPICWYRPVNLKLEYFEKQNKDLLKKLDEMEKVLLMVVLRMNSGPSYWGDAFNSKERKRIQAFLKEEY